MSNGINFQRVIIRNMLSFGNTPTEIVLSGNHITAVLGVNHDTGGDESRNGVGKSAIIDSISYALFGKTIRGISNTKLVNKMVRKGQGMLVTLEFETPEGFYRIERGEAPSKLRLFRKDIDNNNDIMMRDGKTFVHEVSRNKAETTAEIERIIGFDIKLFEFLIANTSESTPFMKLEEAKKREIAERLMGLNRLTERAEELKEDRKVKKRDLVAAESAVEATQQANDRVQRQLDQITGKEAAWEEQRQDEIKKLRDNIAGMEGIDLDEQTEILQFIDDLDTETKRIEAERKTSRMALREAQRDLSDINDRIERDSDKIEELGEKKAKIEAGTCPTCEQSWVPDPSVIEDIDAETAELTKSVSDYGSRLDPAETAVADIQKSIAQLDDDEKVVEEQTDELADFEIHFDDLSDIAMVEQGMEKDKLALQGLENAENPHTETIKDLKSNAMVAIDDSEIRELRKLIDHYNYLIDLLQSKDSFLRKAVIDRWLPKLNSRIAHYLGVLELPYSVRIENDLGMSIKDFGEEFDWGNLSKGQRQRVTIALNLAFQDLFEATNLPINLLMIDELIDSGICNRGANQAVKALRDACENKDKRVFLITHRMDIADQIDDVMIVEMRNRISSIDNGEEEEN